MLRVDNRKNLLKKISHQIPVLLLLLIVFMIYTNRVDDFDLWWHLKQGQIIYETRSIPQKDDFSYTLETPEGIGAVMNHETFWDFSSKNTQWYWHTSIKRNWLSQLILYIGYVMGGFVGIGILKSLVFVSAYLVLYLTMLRRGADNLISLFVLCLIAFIGADFNFTRSQIFSFLLFPCVLYTLYDFQKGGRSIFFLPVFMLLWANLHGGFILGDFVIISLCFAELLKYIFRYKPWLSALTALSKNRLIILFTLSLFSIIASLINPNSYKPFLFPLMQEQSIFSTIEEYHRPMLYEYHAYWFMLILVTIFIIISVKKRFFDLADLFIIALVTIPSLRSIRYIIFFALGSGVFLSYSLTCTSVSLKELRLLQILSRNAHRLKSLSLQLLVLIFIGILARNTISGQVLNFDIGEKRYPSGAVSFIKKNKPEGNMFNPYNWGGYLVWHLYPHYKVFIYGRTLNETAFLHCKQIFTASKGKDPANPLWERLLDAYDVNFIVTSAVSSSGNLFQLVDKLYANDDWKLVYADGKSMIFLKNISDNESIIHQYELSKDKIDEEIITECKNGILNTPSAWGYYETLGYMYMKKNRPEEAFIMFQKYLSMNPNNETIRYYYDLLKQYLETSNIKH